LMFFSPVLHYCLLFLFCLYVVSSVFCFLPLCLSFHPFHCYCL
jgi:hypothetical protein